MNQIVQTTNRLGLTDTCLLTTVSGQTLRLPITFIISQKLSPLVELPPDRWYFICSESLRYELQSYLLRLVAYSAKTKFQLRQKLSLKLKLLRHKKFTVTTELSQTDQDQVLSQVLVAALQNNLIDEKSVVERILRKYSHKPKSYILQKIHSSGISPSDYQDLLGELSSQDSAKQKLLLQKKYISLKKLPEDKQKSRLFAYAARNGFSLSSSKKIIDDLLKKY